MSRTSEAARLHQIKNTLAAKYYSLAQTCKSRPARARMLRKAEAYRNQAAVLADRHKI